MRGNPFLQTVLVLAAFLLAGVPIYRLTRPSAPVSVAADASADATARDAAATPAPVEIEVLCAPAPADFELRNLARTVLAGHGPTARFHARWTTTIPAEGVDLVLAAHWPVAAGDNPAAARLTVRLADGRQFEKTFWAGANGTLDEVFTIPGAALAPTPTP